jgi:hypothetical protein
MEIVASAPYIYDDCVAIPLLLLSLPVGVFNSQFLTSRRIPYRPYLDYSLSSSISHISLSRRILVDDTRYLTCTCTYGSHYRCYLRTAPRACFNNAGRAVARVGEESGMMSVEEHWCFYKKNKLSVEEPE